MAIVCVARTSSAPRAGRARGRAAARRRGRCAAARVRGVVAEGCGERGAAARVRSVAVVCRGCSEGCSEGVQLRGVATTCCSWWCISRRWCSGSAPRLMRGTRRSSGGSDSRSVTKPAAGSAAARRGFRETIGAAPQAGGGGGRYHSGASRQSVASRSRISLKASACDACGGRLGAWGCSLRCVRWQAGCVGVQPVVHGVAASACWRIHVAWTT